MSTGNWSVKQYDTGNMQLTCQVLGYQECNSTSKVHDHNLIQVTGHAT